MAELGYRGADGCPLFALGTQPLDELANGDSPVLNMMDGGGPDHRSLIPLARLHPTKRS
jgi:3-oxoadipate enol-lactonase